MSSKIKYTIVVMIDKWHKDSSRHIKIIDEIFSSLVDPYEILILSYGTFEELEKDFMSNSYFCENFNIIKMSSMTPHSVSVKAALKDSNGEIIVTFGSYQQISKSSIIDLLAELDENTDMVCPWRQNRVDPTINQFQSRIFNLIVKKVTQSDLNDLSCTVRVFRREVLENIDIYGNMFRFMPVVASKKGFRVKEVKCDHHKEYGKTGLYQISLYLNRVIDIFSLYFIMGYTKKPLRFFSSIGMTFIFIGMIIGAFVLFQKIFYGYPIGDRQSLLISLFSFIIGIQIVSVGLLGEIVAFAHGRTKREYNIKESIGFEDSHLNTM